MVKDLVFRTGKTYAHAGVIAEILPIDDNTVKVKLYDSGARLTYYFKKGEKCIVSIGDKFPYEPQNVFFHKPWDSRGYNAEVVSFDYNQIVIRCDFSEEVTESKDDEFFEKDKAYQVRVDDQDTLWGTYFITIIGAADTRGFIEIHNDEEKENVNFVIGQVITAYYHRQCRNSFEFYTEYQYNKEKE